MIEWRNDPERKFVVSDDCTVGKSEGKQMIGQHGKNIFVLKVLFRCNNGTRARRSVEYGNNT